MVFDQNDQHANDKLGSLQVITDARTKNDLRQHGNSKKKEAIISANFPELIDIGIDKSGNIVFIVLKERNIFQGASLHIVSEWHTGKDTYIPPALEQIPFVPARASEVIKWFEKDKDRSLFRDVFEYMGRFSYLSDEERLIVVCSTYLTYIQDHKEIHYLPIVLFFAARERGKTRTGKAATYVSYRGVILQEVREPVIFRFADRFQATLLFDIKDVWKKALESKSTDILLHRFEKGAKVARVQFPERGAFHDMQYYPIYGPTLVASNEPVHKILDTRCVPITMENRPVSYENPVPALGLELKERLTAWRARMIKAPLPKLAPIDGITGRLWDITKPLLQICLLEFPEGLETLKKYLCEIGNEKARDRRQSLEGEIIKAVCDLSLVGTTEWKMSLTSVVDKLNETRQEDQELSGAYVGKIIKALGLRSRHV